jgi:hypothetical protein
MCNGMLIDVPTIFCRNSKIHETPKVTFGDGGMIGVGTYRVPAYDSARGVDQDAPVYPGVLMRSGNRHFCVQFMAWTWRGFGLGKLCHQMSFDRCFPWTWWRFGLGGGSTAGSAFGNASASAASPFGNASELPCDSQSVRLSICLVSMFFPLRKTMLSNNDNCSKQL